MKARALALALCTAALWALATQAEWATGALSATGSWSGTQGSPVVDGEGIAPRRASSRAKRIRRYCRKVRRSRDRMKRSEARREARKRRRLCRRRRARRRPVGTLAPSRPAPAPIQPGAFAPAPVPAARYVSVQAREFYLTLSRPVVGVGEVTIELRNTGEDPHNLVVSPEGTHDPLLSFADHEPGEVSAANLTLPAGRYYLWCSLEGHEAAGMHATLGVQ